MDVNLLYWINSHHCAFLDCLLWGISAVTDLYLLWFLLGVFVGLVDRTRGKRVAVCIFLALALTYVSVELVIKPLIARPRPFAALPGIRELDVSFTGKMVDSPFSFPSGHCASSMAGAWILGAFYRRFRFPLCALVILVAYSRIYLGVHYPSDCIAGLAVGLGCALFSKRLCRVTARNSG
ncbi:MAG: phosphatase PAP2 family protein [bacterium]